MTSHNIHIGPAQNMSRIPDNSVHLVVTSPPYPMIEMWDEIMSDQNPEIRTALNDNNGALAFELMHQELDKVWGEVSRVIIPGGYVCINIGDATRTLNENFALYPNHSRIISYFISNGYTNLPNILWRKQTNAPNKFMGSGMMPAGAYVTLEHEWILIFRKNGKRTFKNAEDKLKRRESSFFWEERNVWFSDMWDIKGVKQKLSNSESRERSAAYPLEIPYRLVNMYSLQGDTVLDPFMGTGTTAIASIICNRNSIGYEIDETFADGIIENIVSLSIPAMNKIIEQRIEGHKLFIENRLAEDKEIKHRNDNLNVPVVTSQETDISLSFISNVDFLDNRNISVSYASAPPLATTVNTSKVQPKSKSAQHSQTSLQF